MTEISGTSYGALCERFSENETFTLSKGGTELTYITAEAVTTRLNTVLGVDGWEFDIEESGQDESHAWVRGRLTVHFGDREISRAQFGECSLVKGGMGIGDARKGAASDALKKCASLFGVGLYLSHREEKSRSIVNTAPPPKQWDTDGNTVGMTYTCETCGEELRDSARNDGSVWLAREKAEYSKKRYHGQILCYNCSRNAG